MPLFNKHHKNYPEDCIYIGRGSKWGNPFVIGVDGDRDFVIEQYRKHLWGLIKSDSICIKELASLDNANLLCFCYPKKCHGDVLLSAAKWAKERINESE